jgi:pyrroline-5-carboxylate reductase
LVEKARVILEAMGQQIEVTDESYLDMATAISGSGPAYIYLVMESLIDAAVHIGFPRDVAGKLVTQTIKGSAAYAQSSEANLSQLRYDVTSPGGTTASAVYTLERGGFRNVCGDAVWSAYRRALELGGNNPNVGPGRNSFNQPDQNQKE